METGLSDLQIQEIWSRDAAAARPSPVANPGTNHVSAGGFGVPLLEWTCTTVPCWWLSPRGGVHVKVTASFSGNCGTDRLSHGAFYVRWSRFLCLCSSGVEQPSALSDVISVPFSFPKTSWTVLFTRSFPSQQHFSKFILLICVLV